MKIHKQAALATAALLAVAVVSLPFVLMLPFWMLSIIHLIGFLCILRMIYRDFKRKLEEDE